MKNEEDCLVNGVMSMAINGGGDPLAGMMEQMMGCDHKIHMRQM